MRFYEEMETGSRDSGFPEDLRGTLSEHVGKLMQGKRILLMSEMGEAIGWPDMSLFDELVEGFKLVGMAPTANVFKPRMTFPSMSKDELNKNTSFLRPMILGKMQAYEDEGLQKIFYFFTPRAFALELQKKFYAIASDEAAEKGWLNGPCSPEEVARMCGQR